MPDFTRLPMNTRITGTWPFCSLGLAYKSIHKWVMLDSTIACKELPEVLGYSKWELDCWWWNESSAQSSRGSGKDHVEVSNNFPVAKVCQKNQLLNIQLELAEIIWKWYETVLITKVLQLMTKLCHNYFMSFKITMSVLLIRKSCKARRIVILVDCSDQNIPSEKIYFIFLWI